MTKLGASSMTQTFSVRRLRTMILVVLVAGLSIYTAVMFSLVQRLSERFGPQVRADLEWRAQRGAQELANAADVGLAVSDPEMVTSSFGAYSTSSDVEAIVAVNAAGKLVAQHGTVAATASLFTAPPGELAAGPGYLVSWAPAVIEGAKVGKVAVAVSTRRLTDGLSLLDNVSWTTVIAGVAGLVLGVIVILFFTRAVSQRDHQLNDYARNLEQKVEARTRELDERNRGMRLVLDNVAQGFITIDLEGTMAAERSAVVDQWFGAAAPGTKFGAMVREHDEKYAIWFELGLGGVRDAFLPLEVCLDQMPSRFTIGERTFEVIYSPIGQREKIDRLLLIVSEVTTQLAREREQREQRELVALFQRITDDRPGLEDFLDEANSLVESLAQPSDPVIEKRVVHTLKGNCAIYGLETFGGLCHEIESELADTDQRISETQRHTLLGGWRDTVHKIARLLGSVRRDVVEVDPGELVRVIEMATHGMPSHDLAAVLTNWVREPIARHLERLGDQAKGLARRLGKGDVAIAINDPDKIRIDGPRWTSFWAAMVHAVRNAVDHGLESADLRTASGKPPNGLLTLTAAHSSGNVAITLADDGAGIDWDAVRATAKRTGLPADTQGELVEVLFTDGVSTRAQTTETSGRGVGLAALRAAVTELGGTIAIVSTHVGGGTTLTCTLPGAASGARAELPLRRRTPRDRTVAQRQRRSTHGEHR
jgi:HPt (histidine-containing phosphotransfer) domain-containing protein